MVGVCEIIPAAKITGLLIFLLGAVMLFSKKSTVMKFSVSSVHVNAKFGYILLLLGLLMIGCNEISEVISGLMK
jgi:hypothetical protein